MQEYIAGDNVASEALFKKGRLVAYTHARTLKTMGSEFGVAIVREYSPNPRFGAFVRHVGASLGLDGFCNITCMHEKNSDTYYLVEADPRPHSWFALSRFAGVDFSAAIEKFLSDSQEVIEPPSGTYIVRHFSRSISNAFREGNVSEIIQWCVGKDGRWEFIPRSDPVMLWSVSLILIRDILYRLPRSKSFLQLAKRALLKIGVHERWL